MIFKNWINTVFGTSGALTGDEIPYDGSTSLTTKIDANAVTKASQGEVDAGTDDTKFVTPLTLEGKPKDIGELKVHAYAVWDQVGGTVTVHSSGNMTSVTRTATGFTEFVFTTATPDANYTTLTTAGIVSGSNPVILNEHDPSVNRTTTYTIVRAQNNNDVNKDVHISSIVIYVEA